MLIQDSDLSLSFMSGFILMGFFNAFPSSRLRNIIRPPTDDTRSHCFAELDAALTHHLATLSKTSDIQSVSLPAAFISTDPHENRLHQLIADLPLYEQALVLQSLKDYILEKMLEQRELSSNDRRSLVNQLIPGITYEHLGHDDLGTIVVKVHGEIAGYFKAGSSRLQNDRFLYEFDQWLCKKMGLPDTHTGFIAETNSFAICFQDIDELSGTATKDSISIAGRTDGVLVKTEISFPENRAQAHYFLPGGLQPALPECELDGADSFPMSRLLLICEVFLFSLRDLKTDGIFDWTIIDITGVLDPMCDPDEIALSKLPIPFVADFNDDPIPTEVWTSVREYLDRVSAEEIAHYAKSQYFQDRTNKRMHVTKSEDPRTGYRHSVPTFFNNRLLSQEQIRLLVENFRLLQTKVQEFAARDKAIRVTQFISELEPEWLASLADVLKPEISRPIGRFWGDFPETKSMGDIDRPRSPVEVPERSASVPVDVKKDFDSEDDELPVIFSFSPP